MSVTATEARALVACTAAYCRAPIGEKCRSILGKPMDACHWIRVQAATALHLFEETP